MDEMDTQARKKKIIIVVVGVIVLIGIIFAVTQYGLQPADTAATTTLEDRVVTIETWKASTAETISNIQTDIDEIESPPSYSADIDALYLELEALKNDILNISFQTVEVTRLEDDYIDVTVFEGNYPVILNLYGADLTDVEVKFPTVYSVQLWGGNTTITAVITPVASWTENYVVELKVVGTVDYASACVGRGQGQTEEGW